MARSMCNNFFSDHSKTHTTEKEFWCLKCQSGFKRERDLIKHRQSQKHKRASLSVSDTTANDGVLNTGTSSQAISSSSQGVAGRRLNSKGLIETDSRSNAVTSKLRPDKRTFSDVNSTEGGDHENADDVTSFGGATENQSTFFAMHYHNSTPNNNIYFPPSSASPINIQSSTPFTDNIMSLSQFHQDPVTAPQDSDLWGVYNCTATPHTPNNEDLSEYLLWPTLEPVPIAAAHGMHQPPMPGRSDYNSRGDGGHG